LTKYHAQRFLFEGLSGKKRGAEVNQSNMPLKLHLRIPGYGCKICLNEKSLLSSSKYDKPEIFSRRTQLKQIFTAHLDHHQEPASETSTWVLDPMGVWSAYHLVTVYCQEDTELTIDLPAA
jgi:hypothetical protein